MKKVPLRYFLLTLVVIIECYFYIYGDMHSNYNELDWDENNGKITITEVDKESNAEKAGLKVGDIILSVQNKKIKDYNLLLFQNQFTPGSIVNYEIVRNGERKIIPVKFKTDWEKNKNFFYIYYLLIATVVFIGYFVLFKKPDEKTSRLFFVFTQIFAVCLNSDTYISGNFGLLRTAIFVAVFPFLGPFITHFFFYFPPKNKLLNRTKLILPIIYSVTILVSSFMVLSVIQFCYNMNDVTDNIVSLSLQIGLLWMGLTLLIAISVSIYSFFTIKEIVVHNQLRWVMIGVLFGLLPETVFGFSMNSFLNFDDIIPHSMDVIWAIGTIVLLTCISFSIIRYRLWEIEVIIKKSLLYSSLTGILIGGYFIIFSLTEMIVKENSNVPQIIGFTFSLVFFIPARELLQKRIDKIFHREKYNPTSAALTFEHSLIGKYDFNILVDEVCYQLNQIFNFSSLYYLQRKNENIFNGVDKILNSNNEEQFSFNTTPELEEYINNNATFALSELKTIPEQLNKKKVELITPIKFEDKLFGCFLCGQKLSERIFTLQDVEMLNLLANRTGTILQMSTLYGLELERQTLLERERLRISKDMHDEVGSSLTKIALLGDLIQSEINDDKKIRPTITKISEISREVVDNISEIIWAINPKNDKLDNLASYIREYVSDFLESTNIKPQFAFMDNFPIINLTADYRRNIFLVAKEALNNIIKHSGATSAVLKLSANDNKLLFSICDNGAGFDIKQNSKFGNGLNNMEKRVNDIGGTFKINSCQGKGTEIMIEVNI